MASKELKPPKGIAIISKMIIKDDIGTRCSGGILQSRECNSRLCFLVVIILYVLKISLQKLFP
jgi:hypothetical protein